MFQPLRCILFLSLWLLVWMSPVAAAPTVLFDEGHGQRFLPENQGQLDLSGLAAVFKSAGCQVTVSPAELDSGLLRKVDILVISGPFLTLNPGEIDDVLDFIQKGGGLAVMLHVAPPLRDLLQRLEVDFTNGTLREVTHLIGRNPLDFSVQDLEPHPLTEGLDRFSVYGAWALRGTAEYVRTVARTSAHAWIDLDHNRRLSMGDAAQPFGVLVAGELGKGRYAVFGDDALFQNVYLDANNRRLAENLVDWLTLTGIP